mmetsp:Transcript_2893/g.7763  ORF Transcript_2893/g.7763 Transcript_2893/m.7763 type:complete len:414 (+) Transcript_2893:206-1447(+)
MVTTRKQHKLQCPALGSAKLDRSYAQQLPNWTWAEKCCSDCDRLPASGLGGKSGLAAQSETPEPALDDSTLCGYRLTISGVVSRAVLHHHCLIFVVIAALHARERQLTRATELYGGHLVTVLSLADAVRRGDLGELRGASSVGRSGYRDGRLLAADKPGLLALPQLAARGAHLRQGRGAVGAGLQQRGALGEDDLRGGAPRHLGELARHRLLVGRASDRLLVHVDHLLLPLHRAVLDFEAGVKLPVLPLPDALPVAPQPVLVVCLVGGEGRAELVVRHLPLDLRQPCLVLHLLALELLLGQLLALVQLRDALLALRVQGLQHGQRGQQVCGGLRVEADVQASQRRRAVLPGARRPRSVRRAGGGDVRGRVRGAPPHRRGRGLDLQQLLLLRVPLRAPEAAVLGLGPPARGPLA